MNMHTNNPASAAGASKQVDPNPLADAGMPDKVDLLEVGRRVCKDLNLGVKDLAEVSKIVQQVLLGKATRPDTISAADWGEVLGAIRYEIIRSFGKNPALTSLCEKAALSFSAFDRRLEEGHQAESLRSLHQSSPAVAESLMILKARDTKDNDLSKWISLLGEFEPALQVVMSVEAIRADGARWGRNLRGALGDEICEAIDQSGALDISKPLDKGALFNHVLPVFGEEPSMKRKIELGRKLHVLTSLPNIAELDLVAVGRLVHSVAQLAVKDTELSACVAAALLGQHGEELKKMGIQGVIKGLKEINPDLADMFAAYFHS